MSSFLVQAKTKARSAGLSIDFIDHDIETASFPERSFDCILCSNGMAYLQHPQATLRKFLAWLATGGVLCFNNPQASAATNHLTEDVHMISSVEISDMFPGLTAGMHAGGSACSAVLKGHNSSQATQNVRLQSTCQHASTGAVQTYSELGDHQASGSGRCI